MDCLVENMAEEKETITFELIRKIHLEEQHSPKLAKLPKDFFQHVDYYLQQKRKIASLKEDKKVSSELKSIEHMVEDIFNRREKKILNQTLVSSKTTFQPENLTPEEVDFFREILEIVKARREKFFASLFSTQQEEVSLVIFKEDFPAFVGTDLRVYGPFKKSDVARLPKENMELLVKRGIAEKLEVKSKQDTTF